jgi:hypothetical protein
LGGPNLRNAPIETNQAKITPLFTARKIETKVKVSTNRLINNMCKRVPLYFDSDKAHNERVEKKTFTFLFDSFLGKKVSKIHRETHVFLGENAAQ